VLLIVSCQTFRQMPGRGRQVNHVLRPRVVSANVSPLFESIFHRSRGPRSWAEMRFAEELALPKKIPAGSREKGGVTDRSAQDRSNILPFRPDPRHAKLALASLRMEARSPTQPEAQNRGYPISFELDSQGLRQSRARAWPSRELASWDCLCLAMTASVLSHARSPLNP
jgi:hypothetical protein